jgi:hypothetical protein
MKERLSLLKLARRLRNVTFISKGEDLHAKVRNASRVPLYQHAVHDGAWSRARNEECRDPRVVSMEMVVMIMRMLVSRMSMIMRMGYRRTSVDGDRRNQHSANPRECNIEMTKSLVFQEAQGEDQDTTQSKSHLFWAA